MDDVGFGASFEAEASPPYLLKEANLEQGRTRYFQRELAATHQRISIAEELAAKPSSDASGPKTPKSLHTVLKSVCRLLLAGQSVCLDDSHALEKTRASIVAEIRKGGHPKTVIKAILFKPEVGLVQAQFAAEWASAYWHDPTRQPIPTDELASSVDYIPPTPYTFRDYRSHAQDVEVGREGIDQAGLFVEFSALGAFTHLGDENYSLILKDNIKETLAKWTLTAPGGRIFFLLDEPTVFPANIELDGDFTVKSQLYGTFSVGDWSWSSVPQMSLTLAFAFLRIAKYRQQLQQAVCDLRMKHLVYCIAAEYGTLEQEDFFRLPQPGMVAWLQFKHRVDLSKSLYVTSKGAKSAPAGLRFVAGEDFFATNAWDVSNKIRKFAKDSDETRLDFLTAIEFRGLVDDQRPTSLDVEFAKRSPSTEWVVVEERAGFGRLHWCCFPPSSLDLSSQAEEQPETIHIKRDRQLPQWMDPTAPKASFPQPKLKIEPKEEPKEEFRPNVVDLTSDGDDPDLDAQPNTAEFDQGPPEADEVEGEQPQEPISPLVAPKSPPKSGYSKAKANRPPQLFEDSDNSQVTEHDTTVAPHNHPRQHEVTDLTDEPEEEEKFRLFVPVGIFATDPEAGPKAVPVDEMVIEGESQEVGAQDRFVEAREDVDEARDDPEDEPPPARTKRKTPPKAEPNDFEEQGGDLDRLADALSSEGQEEKDTDPPEEPSPAPPSKRPKIIEIIDDSDDDEVAVAQTDADSDEERPKSQEF